MAAATSIKGKFLITGSQLIQAPVLPQDAAAGVTQGAILGVQVTVQPLDVPATGLPPGIPLQWPFYQDGAGDLLTPGSTVEMTVTKVVAPAAVSA